MQNEQTTCWEQLSLMIYFLFENPWIGRPDSTIQQRDGALELPPVKCKVVLGTNCLEFTPSGKQAWTTGKPFGKSFANGTLIKKRVAFSISMFVHQMVARSMFYTATTAESFLNLEPTSNRNLSKIRFQNVSDVSECFRYFSCLDVWCSPNNNCCVGMCVARFFHPLFDSAAAVPRSFYVFGEVHGSKCSRGFLVLGQVGTSHVLSYEQMMSIIHIYSYIYL